MGCGSGEPATASFTGKAVCSKKAATVYLEESDYIALCDLLKLAGLVESGGQAKALIAEGQVLRNGAVETRKTAKIRGGETIEFNGAVLEVENGHDPETEA